MILLLHGAMIYNVWLWCLLSTQVLQTHFCYLTVHEAACDQAENRTYILRCGNRRLRAKNTLKPSPNPSLHPNSTNPIPAAQPRLQHCAPFLPFSHARSKLHRVRKRTPIRYNDTLAPSAQHCRVRTKRSQIFIEHSNCRTHTRTHSVSPV